jgi:prepilin-type N-terminal cleavage/methylation domain-containing protein
MSTTTQLLRTAARGDAAGLTLPEVLVAVLLLGLLAALGLTSGGETLARQRVEAATRRLALGIERGRAEAEERGRPCGLSLGVLGWEEPAAGGQVPCAKAVMPLAEGTGPAEAAVELRHNLPQELRFTSNGLVLDGGTVVVSGKGTELRRCLVLALPLGIVRVGRYQGATTGPPDSEACRPDPTL